MQMIIIIAFMASAFILQLLFGYLQVQNFTKAYVELRQKGKVAIGKRPGKFRAGTIVLLAINHGGQIIDAKKMQGVTVFSSFKKLKGLENRPILSLKEKDLKDYNKLLRLTIEDAVNNYKIVMKGGEIPLKESIYRRVIAKAESVVLAKK